MSYLTRLSQQTGLTANFPSVPIPSTEPVQGMLSDVEELTAAPAPAPSVQPTVPPVSSPSAVNPEPLPPFAESQPSGQDALGQESAVSELPAIAAPLSPPAEFSISPPDPTLSSPDAIYIEQQVTESRETFPPRSPEPAIAEIPQLSVVLPDRAIASSSPPASTPNSPSPSRTYLQTLQAVRAWVSAPPEPLPEPEPPQGVQDLVPGEIESASTARQRQGQRLGAMDRAAAPSPFPLAATEPTTVISIGSIEVMVEGPPAPPAPARPRALESPRPSTRLSRHYLRLR